MDTMARLSFCEGIREESSASANQSPSSNNFCHASSPSAYLHEHLGCSDVLVARSANLVHLGHRLSAVGHGKDGLRATSQHNVRCPDLPLPHAAKVVHRLATVSSHTGIHAERTFSAMYSTSGQMRPFEPGGDATMICLQPATCAGTPNMYVVDGST